MFAEPIPESARAKLFVANKTFARELVAALKPVETAAAVVLNKDNAQTPGGKKKGTCANKLEEFRGMPEGKAKDDFQIANASELIRLERDEQAAANKG